MTDPAKKSLLRSSGLVSSMTMISRVLGFVRDQVFAVTFGAGPLTDAFFVAFKIPNFLRRLFAEGAFAQSFVPVFTEYKETRSPEALRELAARVSGTLGLVVLLMSVLGAMFSAQIIAVVAPGFEVGDERRVLAAEMLRITFPYLFFISLVAYAGGALNSFQRFAVPAFTPVFLNICLITAALWGTQFFPLPIIALAWGVFAAGLVQLLFQLPSLYQLGLLRLPRWGWNHGGVSKIRQLMLPAIFGSSVAQINLLLDTIIASFLITGSVSWLYYADRLVEFPLGVFGIAIATVILPRLSALHANRTGEQTISADFQHTMDWAMRLGFFIALPCATGLLVLAAPILATLFGYGEFNDHDVNMSAWALRAYALALPGFILVKILAPGFFARQNTKTPVRIGIVAMVCNMLYNIILVGALLLLAFPAAHAGLALATALSAGQQAFMLYRKLAAEGACSISPQSKRAALKFALAALLMALVIQLLSPTTEVWLQMPVFARLGRLSVIMLAAAVCYGIALLALGLRPRDLIRIRTDN